MVFVSYLGNRPCGSRETSSDYQEWGRDGLTKVYLPAGCWFANAKASKLRPSVEDHFLNICEFYIFLGSVVFLEWFSSDVTGIKS